MLVVCDKKSSVAFLWVKQKGIGGVDMYNVIMFSLGVVYTKRMRTFTLDCLFWVVAGIILWNNLVIMYE